MAPSSIYKAAEQTWHIKDFFFSVDLLNDKKYQVQIYFPLSPSKKNNTPVKCVEQMK